ncbi:PREDICTED: crossover junction endonuclease EME1B isoform X2 [Nelumbo nucifera]|uniref:Crossover junction endonuclease EME1B isoform X2 n=1 Tax=Nelumbo nucifera TaxID=4432 RepID=A0A1U8Q4M4_NELNU|nr:PREDICTED: crossover junction endonuclease EME1B isoform X2 [Nelumbo nucifera]
MSHQPIPVEISDEDNEPISPVRFLNKKQRRDNNASLPTVLVIDDDPTPHKPNHTATPSFVPETPMSNHGNSEVSIVKCTAGLSDPKTRFSDEKFSGISGLIYLESDSESGSGCERESLKESEIMDIRFDVARRPEMNSTFLEPPCSLDADHNKENGMPEQALNATKQKKRNCGTNTEKKNQKEEAMAKKRQMKEERNHLIEERKLKREQEKLQKEALKAEAAERKKMEKEKQKWEKGKLAVKSIVAKIDAKVVELGSVGGHLLTRLSEKGLTFRITKNPIERSILWTMDVPEQIAELSSKGSKVPYVLLVYEAEEFCNMVINQSFLDHVSRVQNFYPSYTVCYLTNKLMAYINKREQSQYKNPSNDSCWKRPPVEEVLSKLTTHFDRVHSRQCIDEAEIAEHVVGLTCSLANCQFRKKLTRLSVNANGALIPKDFIDRNLIKNNVWLKVLVAIPKVQPRFAIAIWKKYPTMKSLLSVYMDPSKSVHEKEFLLKDITTEGPLGNEDRRLGEVCSKRVYRILMAQSGSIKTDDVEDGADFFGCSSSR